MAEEADAETVRREALDAAIVQLHKHLLETLMMPEMKSYCSSPQELIQSQLHAVLRIGGYLTALLGLESQRADTSVEADEYDVATYSNLAGSHAGLLMSCAMQEWWLAIARESEKAAAMKELREGGVRVQ